MSVVVGSPVCIALMVVCWCRLKLFQEAYPDVGGLQSEESELRLGWDQLDPSDLGMLTESQFHDNMHNVEDIPDEEVKLLSHPLPVACACLLTLAHPTIVATIRSKPCLR